MADIDIVAPGSADPAAGAPVNLTRDPAVFGNPHPAPPGQALPAARDVAILRQRPNSLLSEIGREAREREQQRHLPYAFARKVANAGLLTFRIPKAYGGPGGSVRDAIRSTDISDFIDSAARRG